MNQNKNYSSVVYDLVSDRANHFYAVGSYKSNLIFFDTLSLKLSGIREDAFLVKFTNQGVPLWGRKTNGVQYEKAQKVAYDNNGFVIVGGSFGRTFLSTYMIFANDTLISNGFEDVFVLKYDTAGNEIWGIGFGGTDFEYLNDMIVDQYGNIYLTGFYTSDSISINGFIIQNQSGIFGGFYVMKINSNGIIQWLKSYGETGVDVARGIGVDLVGNIYISGSIAIASGSFDTVSITNHYGFFLAMLDSNGNAVWIRGDNNKTDAKDWGYKLVVDQSGNIYCSGRYSIPKPKSLDFDTVSIAGTNNLDVFIVKFSNNGTAIWGRKISSGNSVKNTELLMSPNDKLYVSGFFDGNYVKTDIDSFSNNGGYDMFLAVYDTYGTNLWLEARGGNGGEIAHGIAADTSDNIYLGGAFSSNSITFGNVTLIGGLGNTNYFIVKGMDQTFTNNEFNYPYKTYDDWVYFNVYPTINKSNGLIKIDGSETGDYTFEIYNLLGIKQFEQYFNSTKIQTQLNLGSVGVYIYFIKSNERTLQTGKLLILD